MKTTIKVTSQHIELGVKASASKCALALAFRDAGFNVTAAPNWQDCDPPDTDWHVNFYNLSLITCVASAPLPEAAKNFVLVFDADLPVNPLQFEIDIPTGVLPNLRTQLVHA